MARYIIVVLVLLVIAGGSIYVLSREGEHAPTLTDTIESSDSLLASPQGTTSDTHDTATSTPIVPTDQSTDPGTNGASSTKEAEEEKNIVIYTDAGFDPKEMTIVAGETVTFVNKSTRPFWVASNIHPTHTLYPESSDSDCLGSTFDACGSMAPGSAWSFTFTKVGTWGYHDHTNPTRTGSVTVRKK